MTRTLFILIAISLASPAAAQPPVIDEDGAIAIIEGLPHIAEIRAANPEVRIIYLIEERPEETGRWAIKAMTDQGTHYSNIGIYYINPNTGRVTRMDPLTGEEAESGDE